MQVENGERVWTSADPAIKLFGEDIASISTLLNGKPYFQQLHDEATFVEEKDKPIDLVSNDSGSSNLSCNEGYEEGSAACIQEVSVAPSLCTEPIDVENFLGLTAPEKTSTKPDKPVIPCPRCRSMDTKFCYFNNYNANQPRHFCRKCQRYWTSGGSLRNVPVGAGRRKHKLSSLHTGVSDAGKVRGDVSETAISGSGSTTAAMSSNQYDQQMKGHLPQLHINCATSEMGHSYKPSAKNHVSSFVQESSFSGSMAASALGAAMQNHQSFNTQSNVKVQPEENTLKKHKLLFQTSNIISIVEDKHGDVASVAVMIEVGSSSSENPDPTATHLIEPCLVSQQGEEEYGQCSHSGFTANCEACITRKDSSNREEVNQPQAGSPSLTGAVPVPLSASLPWPFMYPPALWGPLYNWAGYWASLQWGPASAAMIHHSEIIAANVRKRQLESAQSDGCLCVPKTLRIDNPADAARSSIWTTLGLSDRPALSLLRDASKALQKSECKDVDDDHSVTPIRHFNPAALSRSVAFNESS